MEPAHTAFHGDIPFALDQRHHWFVIIHHGLNFVLCQYLRCGTGVPLYLYTGTGHSFNHRQTARQLGCNK